MQEVGTGSHCKKYNIIHVEFLASVDGLINHKDVPNSLPVTAYANKINVETFTNFNSI